MLKFQFSALHFQDDVMLDINYYSNRPRITKLATF